MAKTKTFLRNKDIPAKDCKDKIEWVPKFDLKYQSLSVCLSEGKEDDLVQAGVMDSGLPIDQTRAKYGPSKRGSVLYETTFQSFEQLAEDITKNMKYVHPSVNREGMTSAQW